MRALVTGGAGFIGSHLVPYLMEQGCQVTVLDNLSEGHRDWVPQGCAFVEGDVTSAEVCQEACRDQDYVFHLAAMSRVGSSLNRVAFCTEQNVMGTLTLLQASKEAEVAKVVYVGSSSYYGNQAPPHHEGLPPECLNPYALTKYVGELYCQLYNDLYGLPTITLRLFNVYGARQPREGADALVVGSFFHKKFCKEPLIINGDGQNERDFVYVKDVAKILWQAAQSPASGQILNVGSGQKITIASLAKLIADEIQFAPPRLGDARSTQAEVSRLQEILGMLPSTSLAQGLQETWEEEYGR